MSSSDNNGCMNIVIIALGICLGLFLFATCG